MKTKSDIIPNIVPDYIEERDVLGQLRLKRLNYIRKLFKSSKAPDLNVTYAGLGRRALATGIDLAIVLFSLFLLEFVLFRFYYPNSDFLIYRFFIAFIVWVFYNGLLDGSVYQGTLGKRIVKIKVIDIYGKRMTIFWTIIRSITTFISILPFGLGVWYLDTDRKKQSWHDLMAGSYVIKY